VGAVVLVGAGFGSFFYAGGLADDAKTHCLTVPNCDDKKGDIHTFDALALTGWIAGAGVGAFAVYEWMSSGSATAAKSGAAPSSPIPLRAELVPGIGSLALRGTF
jgi:hypothetical protein